MGGFYNKDSWVYKRLMEEKKKHESWAGDDWIKLAAHKIESEIKSRVEHKDLLQDLDKVREIKW